MVPQPTKAKRSGPEAETEGFDGPDMEGRMGDGVTRWRTLGDVVGLRRRRKLRMRLDAGGEGGFF
jgi:hypothetical protein